MMKKVYIDQTSNTCTAVFVRDAQVISAGATIYSMPVKDKNSEYQRYAEEYDIHFIFDDHVPQLDFYTIPQVDIFATDSAGGYIGSLGQSTDLSSDAPICYIDRNRRCFRIAQNGREFISHAADWKTRLTPCTDVEFYASLSNARETHEFLDLTDLERSLQNLTDG